MLWSKNKQKNFETAQRIYHCTHTSALGEPLTHPTGCPRLSRFLRVVYDDIHHAHVNEANSGMYIHSAPLASSSVFIHFNSHNTVGESVPLSANV